MTLDGLLENMEEYLSQNRYGDMIDKFFYDELADKNQEQIEITEDFSSDDIPKMIKDGELFTENKNYLKNKRNFMLLEDAGEVLVTVDSEGNLKGNATGKFSFPLDSEDSKKAFALMLLYLQQCGTIKFPNVDVSAE